MTNMASDDKNMEDEMDAVETELNIAEYAEARAKEIEAMDLASRKVSGNNKASQIVPNHMRRRAASHNIKRLPRRLRNKAQSEMKEAPPRKTKRPSRKHRRRPGNLLQDYNRRKRRIMWLETHIWHAKRFHMEELWGYKIPNFPNDKSLRACYRASIHHCMMWDMSYLGCIEISGMEHHIINGLKALTSRKIGLPFDSKATLSGSREGTTFIYTANQCPNGAIGPVNFMWKPERQFNGEENSKRTLWIWSHPSVYKNITQELAAVFTANQVITSKQQIQSEVTGIKANEQNVAEGNGKMSSAKVLASNNKNSKENRQRNSDKLLVKFPDVDITTYVGPDVEFHLLKDTLCRFRLLGPQSQAILTDMLEIACVNETEMTSVKHDGKWWEKFYSCEKAINLHEGQRAALGDIKRALYPTYMPPGTILGLTVRDPRLNLPQKRVKVTTESLKETASFNDAEKPSEYSQWPEISYSPIWDSDVRNRVKESMLSEQQINRKRSENLLPGTEIDLGREESRIPIVLIHKPGNLSECVPTMISNPNSIKHSLETYACGWDVIVPNGWGMAFWVGLVYRGARVGGVRELSSTMFEAGILNFPNYCPDTDAGHKMETFVKDRLEDKYKKKPPAKRPNYNKLGVNEPFNCPWTNLVSSEMKHNQSADTKQNENTTVKPSAHPYFVLRDQEQVQKLCPQTVINFGELKQNYFCHHSVDKNFIDETSETNGSSTPSYSYKLTDSLQPSPNCVVAVQLRQVQRGTCELFSHICNPTGDDLSYVREEINYRGPRESVHTISKSGLIAANQSINEEANKQTTELSGKVSREVIGYVSVGGFSLKQGQGAGLGYISQGSLLKIMDDQGTLAPLVLVRATTSFQYSFAFVTVIAKDKLCYL